MVDYGVLQDCLTGLVGWRSSDSSSIPSFTTSQTGSTSGVYVTDEPAITPTNMERARGDDYASVSTYAQAVMDSAIIHVSQEFVNRHKELTRARTLVDNLTPVKGAVPMTDQVTKSGRFVGIIIAPNPSNSIALIIKQVGVQFNTLNTSLNLYLYETSQNSPIATYTLSSHNKVLSLQWFDREFACKYQSTTGGTGQRFLLGYFENDLQGQAVNTLMQGACCGYQDTFHSYRRHVYINGFSVPSTALNGTNLPDITKVGESPNTYGLHIRSYITCDITDVLCHNKQIFALALAKRCAMRIYQDFANNTQVSREADMSRDRALTNYAVVKEQYDELMKNARFDFTDIDKHCLPCSQRDISTGTIV